jgi:DNA-binding LacI/PurR family transcriptional regulator
VTILTQAGLDKKDFGYAVKQTLMMDSSEFSPRPTIKTIAEKLGLSNATISMALRGHPRISEETRLHVKKTAEEMGYLPDPSISKLMAQIRASKPHENRATLGCLHVGANRNLLKNHYLSELMLGIEEQANLLGYRVEIFHLKQEALSEKRLNQILENRGIQGLIIAPPGAKGIELSLNWRKFTAVTIGYGLLNPSLNRIVGNQRQGFCSCLHQLLRTGHQRIGAFLLESFDSRMTFISSSVFQWYQTMIPQKRRVPLLLSSNFQYGKTDDLLRWIRTHKPDAIITHAPQLVNMLREAGIRVPQDLSVVCEGSKPKEKQYTGCFVAPKEVGKRVSKLLDSQLLQHDFGIPEMPVTILMKMQWHEGETMLPRGEPDTLTETFRQTAW